MKLNFNNLHCIQVSYGWILGMLLQCVSAEWGMMELMTLVKYIKT